MTATIRSPDPRDASHALKKNRHARFSSMESLGFIEAPATVSTTWFDPVFSEVKEIPPESPRIKRGAHERTVADLEPNDTSEFLVRKNVRWGLIMVLILLIGALTAGAVWLWQRPAVIAEAAAAEVEAAASSLQSELGTLSNLSVVDSDIDPTSVTAVTGAVDSEARALFNAAGSLPATAGAMRTNAADAATAALDASRLISDAVAYRSAVVHILVPPNLETDPELIALDEAVRSFGTWQQGFNRVRSALPTGTMSDVSGSLAVVAGNLEAIQSRYIDALRDDDRAAAEDALEDLADQLQTVDTQLSNSLVEVQTRADELIGGSLSGIGQLLG